MWHIFWNMTRSEFCQLLKEAKDKSGVPTLEIMCVLRMMPSQLRRIECAENNFALSKALSYLSAIDKRLCVGKWTIENISQTVDWLKEMKADTPCSQLAPLIGVNEDILNRILRGVSSFSIDPFLKTAEYFKQTITIT